MAGAQPHVAVSRRLPRSLACLLLGGALGGAAATVRTGFELHRVIAERDALADQVADLQVRLQRLEESLQRRRRRPVSAVEVRLQGLDPADELRLREQLRPLLDEFVGREVDQVDPALVSRVLDGRLLDLGGRTVRLRLQQLWVTDRLTVWLEVSAPAPR